MYVRVNRKCRYTESLGHDHACCLVPYGRQRLQPTECARHLSPMFIKYDPREPMDAFTLHG